MLLSAATQTHSHGCQGHPISTKSSSIQKGCKARQMVESRVGCLQPETWLQRGGGPGDLTPEGLEHLHDAGNALLT